MVGKKLRADMGIKNKYDDHNDVIFVPRQVA